MWHADEIGASGFGSVRFAGDVNRLPAVEE
jgi:hypothetical protein